MGWFENLFKDTSRKTGIRFKCNISGIEMPEEIIVSNESVTLELLSDLETNPDKYKLQAKTRWIMGGMPNMSLVKLLEPQYIEKDNIYIVAEVFYTYTDPVKEEKSLAPAIFLTILLIVLASFGVFLYGIYRLDEAQNTARARVPECALQFLDNKPYSYVVDSTEYKLNNQGIMDFETRLSLNPWHQEIINTGACKRVNLMGVQPKSEQEVGEDL